MENTTVNPQVSGPGSPATAPPLSRPASGRMLAGVAAGLARYLDVDVTIVRIVFAVLAVAGGVGVPLYLIGWLLIPEEGTGRSIAGDFAQSRQVGAR